MEQISATTTQPGATIIVPKDETDSKPDKYIWGIYIFLCIVSIIELYSASSREVAAAKIGVYGPVLRHIFMLGAGCGIMLLLQRMHYRRFRSAVWTFAFISAAMMLYVDLFGEIVNGARRGFSISCITIQPSEFLKLSSVLVVALVMSKNQIKGGVSTVGVWFSAFAIMGFSALLLKQGLTNTILLMLISMSMMIIGGVEWSKLIKVLLVYSAFCAIVLFVIKSGDNADNRTDTWKERIERFVGNGEPKYNEEINAKNRQEMFSYMAQANGGVFGVFPGNSRETARLPLAFSDFIYSIIIEDTGLFGGVLVLVAYLLLLGRANAITSKCSRVFPALLAMGLAVMIAFQALSHMAIVTGFIPVSGQPLPLISKGGTSIFITSVALGMMLSVSRFAVRNTEKKDKINEEINTLPEDIRAANPTQL